MEFFKKFVKYCENNDNIRALALQGSRVYGVEKIDMFSDYDLIMIVRDIKALTNDDQWVKQFGEILIMQKPSDWFKNPYNYQSDMPFTYLVQYKNGNRLDINIFSKDNLGDLKKDKEPRKIIFKKDDYPWFVSISGENFKLVNKPSEMEFYNTVNEFYWISLYVAKGLKRNELIYTRVMYEKNFMEMLYKMISFYIGIKTDFSISTGKAYKYFKDYLTEDEYLELQELLPSGELEDIKLKLLKAIKVFKKYSEYVSVNLGYELEDYSEIIEFINKKY